MSLVTSIKDYIEVVHKLIETDPNFHLNSYYDFGALLTFVILTGKELVQNFLSFQWMQNLWSIPTLIPDIASALISEISVFDGYLQNTQTFLENPISYGNQNLFIYCLEKFMIGLLNSLFLCFPTSIAHIITLRRFVMQGLEAGFISGLGTIAGNVVWIASIIFGLRFVVIPWLSLDLFRYFLGFVLIVKYMWDSYTERRMVLEDLSKYKIFLLTFLLSFTEQTTIYPFVNNLSFGSDSTLLESFPTENFSQFTIVHCCYLLGILIGSLSFLQFTCWFWENPAFQIYMWFISSFKTTTSFYSKIVNLTFLYLTMICAISNIAYFGLDYTLTNPLGFVHEDRLLDQKALIETAFLNTKASDRNTRRNRGRHGRRERWKRRVRRYRTFDASLYDQGVYDLFTIEDLNYGFDRFWLRRKIRNHRVRFRFFPGPWMRSFKKQLSRPRLESFMGPRVEFFRILFEQAYHPEFHEFSTKKNVLKTKKNQFQLLNFASNSNSPPSSSAFQSFEKFNVQNTNSIYWNLPGNRKERRLKENSTLRKFVRKVNNRIQLAKIQNELKNPQNLENALKNEESLMKPIFSKSWKFFEGTENRNFLNNNKGKSFQIKNDSSIGKKSEDNAFFQKFSKKLFSKTSETSESFNNFAEKAGFSTGLSSPPKNVSKGQTSYLNGATKHLSKKDRFLERYKTFLKTNNQTSLNFSTPFSEFSFSQSEKNTNNAKIFPSTSNSFQTQQNANVQSVQNESNFRSLTLLHPFKFYFQKEQALKRKFQFYGVKLFRNFGVENNAPYFRVMMKRFFYHFKPSLRWERTLRVATMRRARRKNSRIPRKLNIQKTSQILASSESFQSPPNFNQALNAPEGIFTQSGNNVQEKSREIPESLKEKNDWIETQSKPTHFYSLVDKRASRYRYQIYKDVLQHWYYSPLNRFLLKLDVDSFIRRQPNSYFLTKTDEKFLHLKRQLLSEYYETLRWYTYMQHYNTMKNQIGGTKSLSSRAYNQQFAGTFKKIRHLFNVTPSLNESNVLKFDQPLYNEYTNTQKNSLFNDSIIHEELLADDFFFFEKTQQNSQNSSNSFQKLSAEPEDLPNQSARILRDYLTTATPLRQEYIQQLIQEKNSWELTKFLFRGQKIRGTNPLANETDFLNQEKNSLSLSENSEKNLETFKLKDEMWITLLKKCQNKLYDQEALKNYVSLKKEKYQIQKQRHEKYLKNRLERMKESIVLLQLNTKDEKRNQFQNLTGYTSSIQKAMKDSILWETNSLGKSSVQTVEKFLSSISPNQKNQETGKKNFFHKINIRKNRLNSSLEIQMQNGESSFQNVFPLNNQKIQSRVFKKNMQNSVKMKALQILEAENLLKQKFVVKSSNEKSSSLSSNSLSSKIFRPFQKTKTFLWKLGRFPKKTVSDNTNQNFPRTLFHGISKKFPFVFNHSSEFQSFDIFEKNIKFWKKRENALSKRKKIRKTLKRLRNQKQANEKIQFENNDFLRAFPEKNLLTPSRQKDDNQTPNFLANEKIQKFRQKQHLRNSQSWKNYVSFSPEKETNETKSGKNSFLQKISVVPKNFFTKQFQRKRSRLRRYSSFKGRGPIKKRTLREKLKRQFKSLKKYGRNQENISAEGMTQLQKEREKKKVELIQFITQRKYESNGEFLKRDQKQRRTRQIKHRAWKKKKQNFAQKRRKLRKRRRSTFSKIRVFNKKLHRILSKQEIQTWWWQTFFPNFQQTTEKTWQLEKNMQIRKQLGELSEQEILERDQQNIQNSFSNMNTGKKETQELSSLQIGDKDYKPFAIPEALRIREKLVQKGILRFNAPPQNFPSTQTQTMPDSRPLNSSNFLENEPDILAKTKSFLFSESPNSANIQNSKFFVGTNPIPFYAGWDESLRKFVITNRLLSRQGCFSYSEKGFQTFFPKTHQKRKSNDILFTTDSSFTKAPLQGMNAATTLYWQIPFTTYDPDQFFALGMDGFSPLGWRNFSLKHSRQTTKPVLVKNFFSFSNMSQQSIGSPFEKNNLGTLSKNLHLKFLKTTLKNTPLQRNSQEIEKNFEYRRILKKQKRIKKHPRPPVWFPSGSLSQQVLPVHYIYVFYKRSRLPRDRYIRRRLRSTFLNNQMNSGENSFVTKITDFTLRKRAKPRRKYHRKRFVLENNQFLLRRRKFRGFFEENETTRPSSKFFQTSKQEKRNIKGKQRRKIGDSKQANENLRVRQLRRRVQRQVYRPISRYHPRSGGFVWPGDYLRLELVKAPQLNTSKNALVQQENREVSKTENIQNSARKIRKKKRRTLQEWQIQPKKYLLEKHNIKVLKKRLEKSKNINQF